jgi:hypothetical protein
MLDDPFQKVLVVDGIRVERSTNLNKKQCKQAVISRSNFKCTFRLDSKKNVSKKKKKAYMKSGSTVLAIGVDWWSRVGFEFDRVSVLNMVSHSMCCIRFAATATVDHRCATINIKGNKPLHSKKKKRNKPLHSKKKKRNKLGTLYPRFKYKYSTAHIVRLSYKYEVVWIYIRWGLFGFSRGSSDAYKHTNVEIDTATHERCDDTFITASRGLNSLE